MNLLPALVGACPPFYETLVVTAERWLNDDGTISPCGVMSVLSRFVAERLQQRDFDYISELFDVTEEMLASGPQEIIDAVATCFLENLLNIPPERLNPVSFVSLLGPRSKEHCRMWDKFTGVETLGL